MAAITSHCWCRQVNAYEMKAGMVCFQYQNYVIHTWALPRWVSHDGELYKSIYLSFTFYIPGSSSWLVWANDTAAHALQPSNTRITNYRCSLQTHLTTTMEPVCHCWSAQLTRCRTKLYFGLLSLLSRFIKSWAKFSFSRMSSFDILTTGTPLPYTFQPLFNSGNGVSTFPPKWPLILAHYRFWWW